MHTIDEAEALVRFWQSSSAHWFSKDAGFDRRFAERYLPLHMAAARRQCELWVRVPVGALALLILLDQIPRNIFRGSAHAFATDGLALQHARTMVDAGFDRDVAADLRSFVYLPFEHSEAMEDQRLSVQLFADVDNAEYRAYAQAHLDVIARFGRFPHRNRALGRLSTPEEQAWLDAGGGF